MLNRFLNKYGQYELENTATGLFIGFDFNDLPKKIILDSYISTENKIQDICPQPLKCMMRNTTAGLEQSRREFGDKEFTFDFSNTNYSQRFLKVLFTAFCF